MLGKQYRKDVDLVAAEAYEYAKGLNITKDGKDVWVFDIDETTLSNLPYYARDTVAFGYKLGLFQLFFSLYILYCFDLIRFLVPC